MPDTVRRVALAAAATLARRVAPGVRTSRRMADPVTGAPLRALAVADVDLDKGTAVLLDPLTPYESPPEGVHALVWFHGRPLGELTVVGRLDEVVLGLVEHARCRLRFPRWQHLLHDALSTPGGLVRAREEGLDAIDHPADPGTEGSGRSDPSVTVAVCTRDRPLQLQSCLEAITALRDPVAEVLVVDNASQDERTRDVAARFPGVRYVREPRRGLDWARNRALLEAHGEVVAFTDDDVLVHPDWVDGLLRGLREEPTAIGVTGLVVPRELSAQAQVLFELIGGFGRGYRRKWYSADVRHGEVAARTFGGTGGAGTGANMAFHRRRLLALGGFDTALDVGTPTGGGGDLEIFFRVVAAGELLVYEPSAVVRHLHRADLPTLLRQMRGHGTGSYALFLGAGPQYGERQAREFRRLAGWWLLRHHVRGYLEALVHPQVVPWAMRTAETRGALDATVLRYYDRARRQAHAEQLEHGGPSTSGPVRRPATPSPPRTADDVVTVELLPVDGPVRSDLPPATDPGRRTRVEVLRAGEPQHSYTSWPQGSELSPSRLRWELVDQLGPALLDPGTSYDGRGGTPVGAQPLPVEQYEGSPPLSARHVAVLEEQLTGRTSGHPSPAARRTGSATVLLCTRGRPAHLRTALAALAAQQTQRDVQVLVVDNSSGPSETARVAADFPGVEVLHEPRPGLSRARNRGLPHVRGEALVFVDDDVLVPEHWLERLLGALDEDPEVAMVTGNVLPGDLAALESQVFEDYGGLGRGPHRMLYEPDWLRRNGRAVPTWLIGATANAAVRSDWVRRLGPFVEHLGAGTPAGVGEDTEYFYRILHAGGRIRYEPTAWVRHSHRVDRASLRGQLQAYSAGHVAYHLEVALRYGDLRGLRRVLLALPRGFLRQARAVRRGSDDFPRELVRAQVQGHLLGPVAWLRARGSRG